MHSPHAYIHIYTGLLVVSLYLLFWATLSLIFEQSDPIKDKDTPALKYSVGFFAKW